MIFTFQNLTTISAAKDCLSVLLSIDAMIDMVMSCAINGQSPSGYFLEAGITMRKSTQASIGKRYIYALVSMK